MGCDVEREGWMLKAQMVAVVMRKVVCEVRVR